MAAIKNSFSKGLTTINVKASNFMEENKLKTYITTLETEIEQLKKSVGEKVYQGYVNQDFALDNVQAELDEIKEKYVQIQKTTTEIEGLSMREKEILGKASVAGAELESTLFCSQCGAGCKAGYKFCEKCGNKLD